MKRSWNYRRHQRNRKIKQRLRLIKAIDWQNEYWRAPQYGRLDKTKPYDCSCWMCSHNDTHKPEPRLEDTIEEGLDEWYGCGYSPEEYHDDMQWWDTIYEKEIM